MLIPAEFNVTPDAEASGEPGEFTLRIQSVALISCRRFACQRGHHANLTQRCCQERPEEANCFACCWSIICDLVAREQQ